MRLIDAEKIDFNEVFKGQSDFAKDTREAAQLLIDRQPDISRWIPVEERLPEDGNYILLSFSNFSLPMVGRYETEQEGGAFYLGDCDEDDTCISQNLYVNAWMPLPEPYRPEE